MTAAAPTLLKTPLCDWHAAHGGRMVDFAGWLMPVQYASIVEEHHATRKSIGLFDVSHMGRIFFPSADAAEILDSLLTRSVKAMKPGDVRYSLVTNDSGGILDDVLVYCMLSPEGHTRYSLVVNASNREKIVAWLKAHSLEENKHFIDSTLATAMIAVQGPRAIEIAKQICPIDPGSLKYYTAVHGSLDASLPKVEDSFIASPELIISRTGYTGEDGCELIVHARMAVNVWTKLVSLGATPCGLGCRDTLRLEAAMPLYGHELNEEVDPYQAGLGFAVNLKDRQFPGRDALAALKNDPNQLIRVGLELDGKRVPREHYSVYSADELVGEITSGTFSPTFERPIAMAYVKPAASAIGNQLSIDIRGKREAARVVMLPFYKRAS